VTKAGAARLSFWLADPHRTSVQKQFSAGTTPFEFTKNYKFTVLNNENIWASDEPRRQRKMDRRQGGRRDDRAHQAVAS
jgi:hypothetical protein